MREIIADKELSGAQPVQDDGADNEFIEAANDNEHRKPKPDRPTKGRNPTTGRPSRRTCVTGKRGCLSGVTKSALRAAIQRGQMPGHKTRSNPEDEKSDGTWWFNAKARDELADELLECEPPEWHNWKSYWTYDRKKRKFSPANKEDCQTVKGKQVYSPEFQNWSNSKTTSPAKHENDQQYHQCRFEHYIHGIRRSSDLSAWQANRTKRTFYCPQRSLRRSLF